MQAVNVPPSHNIHVTPKEILRNPAKPCLSIADPSRKYSLSDLLPYDPSVKCGVRLHDGIKEYDFLLTLTESAMRALTHDQLSHFDPLVGENMCQIRALKNCLLFSEYPINPESLLQKVFIARHNLETLNPKISRLIEAKTSLRQLLNNENLEINLTYSEIYLIQSFILTEVKVIKAPKIDFPFIKNEYTDYKRLKEILPIGTMFAENLIKKLRRLLSVFSVSFVKELSAYSYNSADNKVIASDKFLFHHGKLHCLPCYWVTKTLLSHAVNNDIPITIIYRQMAKDQDNKIIEKNILFFKPSLFESKYTLTTLNSLHPESPSLVLIINACRKASEFPSAKIWNEEIQKINPLDLILAYSASHRQYPNIKQDHITNQIQDPQFHYYKKKAEEWGCSTTNPSFFFLSHALCDKIKNIENSFQNDYFE